MTTDRVEVGVSVVECRALNDRWRALKKLVLAAWPDAWAVVVTVRLDRAGLSSSVMVVDGSFETLDLSALESWGELLEEAVSLLGPGEFGLSRPEGFRVAVPKGGFASAGRWGACGTAFRGASSQEGQEGASNRFRGVLEGNL